MPSFHPDIQDLISKMLIVDPTKRMTMAEIKSHRAFRHGLPAPYVLPTPIPVAALSEPLQVREDELNDEMKLLFTRIGINADELATELRATGGNLVKLFVVLLTQKLEIGELPWDQAITRLPVPIDSIIHNPVLFDDAPLFERDTAAVWKVRGRKIDRSRRQSSDCGPFGPFSTPHLVEWFTFDHRPYQFDRRFECAPANLSLEELMWRLQDVLLQNMFCFFHPDDHQLLGKDERNGFVRITATYEAKDRTSWFIETKDVTEDIVGACQAIGGVE
jgi:hypothetical protein